MALDLLWMEAVPRGGALYRHYEWTEPTVTFGYFQKWSEVSRSLSVKEASDSKSSLRGKFILQRRPTGGGIVVHPHGFTYTLILSETHPWYRRPAHLLYKDLHHAIVTALGKFGVASSLSVQNSVSSQDLAQCQIQPVRYDVLESATGRKLAGAAMKRTRNGLLFQGHLWTGTLQRFPKSSWNDLFFQELSQVLALPSSNDLPSSQWSTEREHQLVDKLSSIEWQMRR